MLNLNLLKTDYEDLIINTLAIYNYLAKSPLFEFFECIDMTQILISIILHNNPSIQISVIQFLCKLTSSSKNFSILLSNSDLIDFLYENLNSKNNLLLKSLYQLFTLIPKSDFFENSLMEYGINMIIQSIKNRLKLDDYFTLEEGSYCLRILFLLFKEEMKKELFEKLTDLIEIIIERNRINKDIIITYSVCLKFTLKLNEIEKNHIDNILKKLTFILQSNDSFYYEYLLLLNSSVSILNIKNFIQENFQFLWFIQNKLDIKGLRELYSLFKNSNFDLRIQKNILTELYKLSQSYDDDLLNQILYHLGLSILENSSLIHLIQKQKFEILSFQLNSILSMITSNIEEKEEISILFIYYFLYHENNLFHEDLSLYFNDILIRYSKQDFKNVNYKILEIFYYLKDQLLENSYKFLKLLISKMDYRVFSIEILNWLISVDELFETNFDFIKRYKLQLKLKQKNYFKMKELILDENINDINEIIILLNEIQEILDGTFDFKTLIHLLKKIYSLHYTNEILVIKIQRLFFDISIQSQNDHYLIQMTPITFEIFQQNPNYDSLKMMNFIILKLYSNELISTLITTKLLKLIENSIDKNTNLLIQSLVFIYQLLELNFKSPLLSPKYLDYESPFIKIFSSLILSKQMKDHIFIQDELNSITFSLWNNIICTESYVQLSTLECMKSLLKYYPNQTFILCGPRWNTFILSDLLNDYKLLGECKNHFILKYISFLKEKKQEWIEIYKLEGVENEKFKMEKEFIVQVFLL